MATADVTIRGAGIFGLSIAWTCVERGARVRVIDPNGAAAGASGGIVGALAPHVPENWNAKKQFQLESLLMAAPFWRRVHEVSGIDPGYARTGRIQPVMADAARALAETRADYARHLWQGQAEWRVCTLRGTWLPESPTGHYIKDTLSARIHPRRACAALQAALAQKGVAVETDAPDEGAVIWATGVQGLAALGKGRPRPVGTAIKGQAALFAFEAAEAPQLFVDGLHIIPHLDGTVAVGSTSEREFDHPDETDAQLDRLIDKARLSVPALAQAAVIQRWAGLRPRSRSRAPVLGPWPDRPGHFVANGGFKIGFGMALKVAEVMSDLVLEHHDSIPDDFRIEASF